MAFMLSKISQRQTKLKIVGSPHAIQIHKCTKNRDERSIREQYEN